MKNKILLSFALLLTCLSSTSAVEVYIENQTQSLGNTFDVPIKVRSFQNVATLQFTIGWDSTILKYIGINSTNISIGISIGSSTALIEPSIANPNAFVKKFLELHGQTVNGVILSTQFALDAKAAITQGVFDSPVYLRHTVAHVDAPKKYRSLHVSLKSFTPLPPFDEYNKPEPGLIKFAAGKNGGL